MDLSKLWHSLWQLVGLGADLSEYTSWLCKWLKPLMAILGMVYYWVCHINEYLTNELMNSWKIMDMILTLNFGRSGDIT